MVEFSSSCSRICFIRKLHLIQSSILDWLDFVFSHFSKLHVTRMFIFLIDISIWCSWYILMVLYFCGISCIISFHLLLCCFFYLLAVFILSQKIFVVVSSLNLFFQKQIVRSACILIISGVSFVVDLALFIVVR